MTTCSTSSIVPLQRRGEIASALRMAGGKRFEPIPAPVTAANVRKKSRRLVELMGLLLSNVRNDAATFTRARWRLSDVHSAIAQ